MTTHTTINNLPGNGGLFTGAYHLASLFFQKTNDEPKTPEPTPPKSDEDAEWLRGEIERAKQRRDTALADRRKIQAELDEVKAKLPDDEQWKAYQAFIENQAEAERQKEIDKGEFEKARERIAQEHQQKFVNAETEWQGKEAQYRQLIRQYAIDGQIREAAISAGAENPDHLVTLMRDRFQFGIDNGSGTFRVSVKAVDTSDLNADGEPSERFNKEGKPVTVTEDVQAFLSQYPTFVKRQTGTGPRVNDNTNVRPGRADVTKQPASTNLKNAYANP
jgi:multidrug efflux pump subunit AcrA (membrane-fusion protein)